MSAYMYDEAIIKDLRRIIGDDRIKILPIDNAFDVIPRTDNDNFTLPLITLTRTGWSIQSLNSNHAAKYEGGIAEIERTDKYCDLNIKRVQFVPMQLSYALDVWTRHRQENDEIIRELYWYFLTSPTLQVSVPYDLDFDHNFNIYVDEEIEDNSDIAQHKNNGEYFRQTINIFTEDAKLWKSSSRGPTSVEISIEDQEYDVDLASTDTRSANDSSENNTIY